MFEMKGITGVLVLLVVVVIGVFLAGWISTATAKKV